MRNSKYKTAVVTGATGGIGKSISFALARNNINVCLVGRDREKLNTVENEIKHNGVDVQGFCCDLSSIKEIKRTAIEIIDYNENIDILIHSAGAFFQASFDCTTVSDFDAQYFINTRAPFLLTQLLLAPLKAQAGEVVFVNSSVAMQSAQSNLCGYTASKYALKAIADSLRSEVNQFGVRVLSVFPGRTATAMQERIYSIEDKEYKSELLLQPDDIAESVIASLLLPRTAEITDVNIRPFIKS